MKKCINCESNIRDNDVYCRNCGCGIKSNAYYVMYKVITIILVIAILLMITLFITSYYITKR